MTVQLLVWLLFSFFKYMKYEDLDLPNENDFKIQFVKEYHVSNEIVYSYVNDPVVMKRFFGCYEVELPPNVPVPYSATSNPKQLRFELLQEEEQVAYGKPCLKLNSNLTGNLQACWKPQSNAQVLIVWSDGYEGLSLKLRISELNEPVGTATLSGCGDLMGQGQLKSVKTVPCPIAPLQESERGELRNARAKRASP